MLNFNVDSAYHEMVSMHRREPLKYDVKILDHEKGIATACLKHVAANVATKYCVDFSKPIPSRCCTTYSQQGWFCEHAYAVLAALQWENVADLYTEKYFTVDCFTSSLLPMRGVTSLYGAVPSTEDVESVRHATPESLRKIILPVVYVNNKTVVDHRRIPSAGEGKQKRKQNDLVECPVCSKRLRYDTLHGNGGHVVNGSACKKHQNK